MRRDFSDWDPDWETEANGSKLSAQEYAERVASAPCIHTFAEVWLARSLLRALKREEKGSDETKIDLEVWANSRKMVSKWPGVGANVFTGLRRVESSGPYVERKSLGPGILVFYRPDFISDREIEWHGDGETALVKALREIIREEQEYAQHVASARGTTEGGSP